MTMTTQTKREAAVIQLSAAEQRHFGESLFQKGVRRLSRDYLTLAALVILVILALLAIFGTLLTNLLHINPTSTDPSINFLPIGSAGHILGTDDLGRDQLARLLQAGRISMSIGFFG